ncbi:MAG: hypothetical protein LBC83_07700 [Oscillospiraceae bacterium]|jgi:energy-coupling factor transporter ATP-binding protein EcfA2|nr:hypothetical protein [Oscillospiraceae bacterium]
MVTIITGNKGTGKTKQLVRLVNAAVEKSSGNVICIEQKHHLTYEVSSRARLISTAEYNVMGYDAYYGFLSGICAGDHDISDVFTDATLRIGGRDYAALAVFLEKVVKLSESTEKNFTFTISADPAELPAKVFEICASATVAE